MKRSLLILVLFLSDTATQAQVFDERFDDWPLKTSVRGTIIAGMSLDEPGQLQSALPKITSELRVVLMTDGAPDSEGMQRLQAVVEAGDVKVTRRIAGDTLASQLHDQLASADVFCWVSDRPLTMSEREAVRDSRKDMESFMNRDGTLILIGPHCRIASKSFPVYDRKRVLLALGLNLIPDSIMQPESDAQSGDDPRLLTLLRAKPRTFGIELQPNAAVVLKGRNIRVLGEATATFRLPKCAWLPARKQVLAAQSSGRQDPNEYLVDLTEWRRDAVERTLEQFPPAQPNVPRIDNGSLVIVGGGGMPDGLMQRFVDLAGGPKARLVYVPCSQQDRISPRQRIVDGWEKMGVQNSTYVHTKDRTRANEDDEVLQPLREATGIWFGGGRQWNLADSYYGTAAHKLMKDVLRRGGVIGGSSAGASIQARYLARATPIQNFRIMAPGYERGGLGFISGVAIDQHFTQRGRQKDMTQLVNRYPQLLGIGIDEGTALIVHGSAAEIVGKGRAFFYDRRLPVVSGEPDYQALPAGSSYELAARKVLTDASNASDESEPGNAAEE